LSSATLVVTNGEVSFKAGSTTGFFLNDNIDPATGNGSVSVSFGSTVDNGSLSVAAAQRFLRESVIVKVKDPTKEHTMVVKIYGETI
jgi:hypothetical protein